MFILAIQVGHNSSVCLYKDKKLIYYNQEERLSKLKKDGGLPILCLDHIKKITPKIDVALCTGYDPIYSATFIYNYLLRLSLIEKNNLTKFLHHSHQMGSKDMKQLQFILLDTQISLMLCIKLYMLQIIN